MSDDSINEWQFGSNKIEVNKIDPK